MSSLVSLPSRLWSALSSSAPNAPCTEGSISTTRTVDSVSLVSQHDVPHLSTSRLLFVHIGYTIYYSFAPIVLITPAEPQCRCSLPLQILCVPCSRSVILFLYPHRPSSPPVCPRSQLICRHLKANTPGSESRTCSPRLHANHYMARYLISLDARSEFISQYIQGSLMVSQNVLYTSIVIFALGSLLCGAAKVIQDEFPVVYLP